MLGMTARRDQVVGIPFPYADLQTRKRRPVVMLTEPDRHGDFIAVAVTSVPIAVLAVPITNDDLADGMLPKPSWALQALVGSAAGSLSSNPLLIERPKGSECPHDTT